MGARVLNGFATATTEALMMQVVTDMFFLHERGVWTGVYLWVVASCCCWAKPALNGRCCSAWPAALATLWVCSLVQSSRAISLPSTYPFLPSRS
jgi:hypothetical protein